MLNSQEAVPLTSVSNFGANYYNAAYDSCNSFTHTLKNPSNAFSIDGSGNGIIFSVDGSIVDVD